MIRHRFLRFEVFLIFLVSVQAPVFGQSAIECPTECSYYDSAFSLPLTMQAEAAEPSSYELAVFYAVPTDVSCSDAVYQTLVEATLEIQGWYQVATGGLTWKLAFPEIVRVYNCLNTRQYYPDNGNWWGSLLAEMSSQGLPIWSPGTVAALWAHGAGWWAGAAQGCSGDCGVALLGVEIFPEFNNPDYSGGDCPGGVGGGAWPCTPLGAYAHELGHTLGLPHPADDPATAPHAFHSIMQTHWNYPDYAPSGERPWGFLTAERNVIRSNPFMHIDISLYQWYPNADVVNLPVYGPVPEVEFDAQVSADSVTFINDSDSLGVTLFYWTFGDGDVSNDVNPIHAYPDTGTYTAILRASSHLSMMGIDSMEIDIDSLSTGILDFDDRFIPDEFSLFQNYPNPFNPSTVISYSIPHSDFVTLKIYDILGRETQALVSEFQKAGTYSVNFDASKLSSGVYFCQLQAGSDLVETKKMLLIR